MPTIREATIEQEAKAVALPQGLRLAEDPKENIEYSPQLASYIVREVGKGRSLVAVCRQEGMPHHCAFLRWCLKYPELGEEYTLSKKIRAHAKAEEVADITDTLDPLTTGKTEAYVADIKAKNLLRLAELGDPASFSPKMQHAHIHSGGVVTITMDLGDPQSRQIIDTTASQVPETPQISSPSQGAEVEKVEEGGPSQPESP